MDFTCIKTCDVNGELVTIYQRHSDMLYDVTSTSEDRTSEEYKVEGVDLLTARVAYANQVMFLAGAN